MDCNGRRPAAAAMLWATGTLTRAGWRANGTASRRRPMAMATTVEGPALDGRQDRSGGDSPLMHKPSSDAWHGMDTRHHLGPCNGLFACAGWPPTSRFFNGAAHLQPHRPHHHGPGRLYSVVTTNAYGCSSTAQFSWDVIGEGNRIAFRPSCSRSAHRASTAAAAPRIGSNLRCHGARAHVALWGYRSAFDVRYRRLGERVRTACGGSAVAAALTIVVGAGSDAGKRVRTSCATVLFQVDQVQFLDGSVPRRSTRRG